jgi:hypothetical protein
MNFTGVKSQCIDSKGKCLILNFKKISLVVWPPYAPIDTLPAVDTYNKVSIAEAKTFASERGMNIQKNEVDLSINGLYLSRQDDNRIYFVPLEYTSFDNSVMTNMRQCRNIANYLKSYSVFEWSYDPGNFSLDNYIINKGHQYDLDRLQGKLLRHNDIMYKNKKLIVLSAEMAKRLYQYVLIQSHKYSEETLVQLYQNKKYVDGYVDNPDNYDNENCAIFTEKSYAFIWKLLNIQNVHKVMHNIYPKEITEPYLISMSHILNGKICLVQNIKDGDKNTAIDLCQIWADHKINAGYYHKTNNTSKLCNVYDADKMVQSSNQPYHIILVADNVYAALLPM